MPEDEMPVGEMSVSQMCVGQMFVGHICFGKLFFDKKMWNHFLSLHDDCDETVNIIIIVISWNTFLQILAEILQTFLDKVLMSKKVLLHWF